MEYEFGFDFFKEIYWVIEDFGIFKYLLLAVIFAISYPNKESSTFHNETVAFLTAVIVCALISLAIMGSRVKNIEASPLNFVLTKVSGSKIILDNGAIKSIRPESITRTGYIDDYLFGGGESKASHCRIIIETLDGKLFYTTEGADNDCPYKAFKITSSLSRKSLTLPESYPRKAGLGFEP